MVIGVSGYGATGASAVFDLIREYDEVVTTKSGRECEFILPYECDGLLYLEFALMNAPSKHVNGDYAIARFKKFANWLSKSYDRETDGHFSKLTEDYINSLIQVESTWVKTYEMIGGDAKNNIIKLLRFLELKIEKCIKKQINLLPRTKQYISVRPEGFEKKTKEYISNILAAAGYSDSNNILLDQPFPPNFPSSVFHYFDNPYAIIVNRDPRDLYVYAKFVRAKSVVEFIPCKTVESFVKYYRSVSVKDETEDSSKVLRMYYEDVIYEYEDAKNRIENFLGISNHKDKNKWLQPDVSINNTQIYKAFPEAKEDIEYIERELREYLYPFDKYDRDVDKSKIISNDKFQKEK